MQQVDSFCGSERQSRLSVRSAASAAAGCPGEAWPLLLRNQHPPRKRLSDFSCCHSSTLCVATDPLTGNAERSLTVQARLARSFPTLSSAAPIQPTALNHDYARQPALRDAQRRQQDPPIRPGCLYVSRVGAAHRSELTTCVHADVTEPGAETYNAVTWALKAGYRHIGESLWLGADWSGRGC